MATGETVGSLERQHPGRGGLAARTSSSERRKPISKLQIDSWKNTPRGAREGGRMRAPI